MKAGWRQYLLQKLGCAKRAEAVSGFLPRTQNRRRLPHAGNQSGSEEGGRAFSGQIQIAR